MGFTWILTFVGHSAARAFYGQAHLGGGLVEGQQSLHLLLWRLASEYRSAKRVHLILDNASVHTSKKTQKALAQLGGRLVLHLLPPYCLDANRIERV